MIICERCPTALVEDDPMSFPYCPVCGWCPDCGDSHPVVADRRTICRMEGGFLRSDGCHVASLTDFSRCHLTYPTGYNPTCGWCYLNASHSEEAHQQALDREASYQR